MRPARAWFGLFAALFAAALVLDQLWWGGFEVLSWHGLVVLAALGVLTAPTSPVRFALLLGATVVSVGYDLPSVGTHRLVLLVVAGAVLAQLAVMARRRPGPDAVMAAIAPFLRATVVVVYLGSALAKVNASFLDPAVSCASPMVRQVLGPDPRLLGPALAGTVAVEALLPVLLLVRRTRLAGVVVGTGFHVVLALAGNVPFSAVMLALYVAFLPADVADRLRVHLRPPTRLALFAVLLGGWLVGAAVGPADDAPGLTGAPSASVSPPVGTAATLAYVGLAVGLVLLALEAGTGRPARPTRPAPVLALATAVLVVDALCPYLGLKTDTSFEMFSGLRTEAGGWNHLVVPEAVRVFGYQGEQVEVVAASDPTLVARTAGGRRMMLFELDRALRGDPGAAALYRPAAGQDLRTLGPLPTGETVVGRLGIFRDVPPPGVPRC